VTDSVASSRTPDVARAHSEAIDARPPVTDSPPLDFVSVYRAELCYVWRTLQRLGARPADLEDLAHDVFVVVHRRLGDFEPGRPVRPWLFGIAFRVASDYRRRARYKAEIATGSVEAPSPSPRADERLAVAEDRALVLASLAELDLDRRAVLILHDIDGEPAPEIARVLDIPVNTVYSRLRVARQRFTAAVRRRQLRRGRR